MKISKKQLKQIIREEYSRLKIRKVIRENYNMINDMVMFLDDLMMSERGMELEYGGKEAVIAELQKAFPKASMDEIMEAMASF